jgi:hypothetical protein
MKVFASGSCRVLTTLYDGRNMVTPIHSMIRNFVGCNFVAKLHTPQQHIQLIKIILGQLILTEEEEKHFFTAKSSLTVTKACDDVETSLSNIKKEWDHIDVFIFEICSIKEYVSCSGILESWELRNPETKHNLYTELELESSILQLWNLINKRPMILVGHFRPQLYGGNMIEKREIIHRVLDKIEKEHGIPYIDPSMIIKMYGTNLLDANDHWNDHGHCVFFDVLYVAIDRCLNNIYKN